VGSGAHRCEIDGARVYRHDIDRHIDATPGGRVSDAVSHEFPAERFLIDLMGSDRKKGSKRYQTSAIGRPPDLRFEPKSVNRDAVSPQVDLEPQSRARNEPGEEEVLRLGPAAHRASPVRDEVVAGDFDEQTAGSSSGDDASRQALIKADSASCPVGVHLTFTIAYPNDLNEGSAGPRMQGRMDLLGMP
jgi:hypothetical protein